MPYYPVVLSRRLSIHPTKLIEIAVCDPYPSSKRTSNTGDELRYVMLCQKKQKNEMLPPTSNSLRQHLKQANYQTHTWRHSLDATQDLSPPEEHGWEIEEVIIEDGVLKPLLVSKGCNLQVKEHK